MKYPEPAPGIRTLFHDPWIVAEHGNKYAIQHTVRQGRQNNHRKKSRQPAKTHQFSHNTHIHQRDDMYTNNMHTLYPNQVYSKMTINSTAHPPWHGHNFDCLKVWLIKKQRQIEKIMGLSETRNVFPSFCHISRSQNLLWRHMTRKTLRFIGLKPKCAYMLCTCT